MKSRYWVITEIYSRCKSLLAFYFPLTNKTYSVSRVKSWNSNNHTRTSIILRNTTHKQRNKTLCHARGSFEWLIHWPHLLTPLAAKTWGGRKQFSKKTREATVKLYKQPTFLPATPRPPPPLPSQALHLLLAVDIGFSFYQTYSIFHHASSPCSTTAIIQTWSL